MNTLQTNRLNKIKELLGEVKLTLQDTRKNEFTTVVDVLDDSTKVVETHRVLSIESAEMSIQKLLSCICLLENMEENLISLQKIQDVIDKQRKLFNPDFDGQVRVWVSTQYGDKLFTKEAADAREACS